MSRAVRVVCVVSLYVELWSEFDGPEGRIAAEAFNLGKAAANAKKPQDPPAKLNPEAGLISGETAPGGVPRPYYVLPNVRPIDFSFVFNTFRRADEAEFTFPLELLPVPPDAVRVITCFAAVRHLPADDWDAFQAGKQILDASLATADFAGICSQESISIQPGEIPTVKLPFRDYLGLLAAHKVPPGAALDRTLPISQAITKFLEGSPAEGLEVVWVDPSEREPSVEEHIPKAQKKPKGKKQTKPPKSTQSFLDVITEECARLGCIARMNVARVEISNAGPLYEGQLANTKALILVSQVVESLEAEHALVGLKTHAIQLVGYNPDTGDMYTARWPPDPKGVKTQVVEPGKPPRLPPVTANVGLPGYEQMEESIALIPYGAVASQDRLLKAAQLVFLEKTRQRVRYTLKTHAPWSNPYATDVDDGGQLLRLRAGDTVTFGYLAAPGEAEDGTGALLPPVVRALTGTLSPEGNAALLERIGVEKDLASKIGAMIAASPRLAEFRVDELRVSGGAGRDAELTLKLANFTQIIDDVQREAEGRTAAETVQRILDNPAELVTMTVEALQSLFAEAQRQIDEERLLTDNGRNGSAGGDALRSADNDMQAKIDAAYQDAMKGR